MVADLKAPISGGGYFWVLPLLWGIAGSAYAQVLVDPTRPPTEVSAPQASGEQAAVAEANRLQSIIISPTRRAAIINGQTVELGAKLGNTRLVEVSERGVVLEGMQGRQMLALFPGVELKQNAGAEPKQKTESLPAQAKSVKRAKKKTMPPNKADEPAIPKERK